MNSKIKLINGYFIQELTEQEIKQYNKLIDLASNRILIVCKPKLVKQFEEINVVSYISKKVKNFLDLDTTFYLEEQKENSREITLYGYLRNTTICIVDRDYLSDYKNNKYRTIILSGYYDSLDNSLIEALDL